MIAGFRTHLGEATLAVGRRTPFTLFPSTFFFLLLVTAAYEIGGCLAFRDGAEPVAGLAPAAFLVGVLAVAAAALASFLAAIRLLEDLRRTGLLIEVLAAPLAGWAAALAWLLPATLAGLVSGVAVLLMAAGYGAAPWGVLHLLPLLSAAALFAALGLLLWSFLSAAWLEAVKLYLLPLLVLFAVVFPWGGKGVGSLALVNPLHHASRALHVLMLDVAGQEALLADERGSLALVVSVAAAVALPAGAWLLALGLNHLGAGIRSKV